MSLWQFGAVRQGFIDFKMVKQYKGPKGATAPSVAEFDAVLDKFGDF